MKKTNQKLAWALGLIAGGVVLSKLLKKEKSAPSLPSSQAEPVQNLNGINDVFGADLASEAFTRNHKIKKGWRFEKLGILTNGKDYYLPRNRTIKDYSKIDSHLETEINKKELLKNISHAIATQNVNEFNNIMQSLIREQGTTPAVKQLQKLMTQVKIAPKTQKKSPKPKRAKVDIPSTKKTKKQNNNWWKKYI